MLQTAVIEAWVKPTDVFAVKLDLDVIAVGKYDKGNDHPIIRLAPGKQCCRLQHNLRFRVNLRTIEVSGIFGGSECAHHTMVTDLITGAIVTVRMVIECTPSDRAHCIFAF